MALPHADQTEAHSALAKPTLLTLRHRSHAERTVSAPSHRAAEATAMLAEPTPSACTTEVVQADEVWLDFAPRTEVRGAHAEPCRRSPQPGSPRVYTPCSTARVTEVSRARLEPCRSEVACSHSRPDEAIRHGALAHTTTREIHLTAPSSARPRNSQPEDRAFHRARRPKTALSSDAELTERIQSALRRKPTSSRPLPARPKPRGAERRNARPAVAIRAERPKVLDSRPSPDRSRTMQPASVRLRCKQQSSTSTGQTSRGEHTYAHSHVRARSMKVVVCSRQRERDA
jgi:hypothetical protein